MPEVRTEERTEAFMPCALIPVYDHEHAVGAVVAAVLAHALPCILIDDGSGEACARVLDALAAASPGRVWLVRHAHNQGKGAAVLSGFAEAARLGYTHALQIDADGQHCSADIPRFLQAAQAHPRAVVTGYPVYDESVPALRLYARYLTHVWIWINTLSFAIRDSMCGFRVYPVGQVCALAARRPLGRRMNFDPEILVRLYWEGARVVNLPTRVSYPLDGVSHFQAVRDNVLISRMHAMLFFGMLARLPVLLARKLRPS
jgi:glycosyltransferase involved in cell wall biosynthesis